MEPYFYDSQVVENGKLILQNLPFINGDKVDIILLKHGNKSDYALRGTNFKYINPFESFL
jgi:hypothetical protein